MQWSEHHRFLKIAQNLRRDSLMLVQLCTGMHNAISDGLHRRHPLLAHCVQDQPHCICRRRRLHDRFSVAQVRSRLFVKFKRCV